MVNLMNNNSAPWPNTIPDQMPWLNPEGPPGTPMQFVGQQNFVQPVPNLPTGPAQLFASHTNVPLVTPISNDPQALVQNLTPRNNPFDPQQTYSSSYTQANPMVGSPYESIPSPSQILNPDPSRIQHHNFTTDPNFPLIHLPTHHPPSYQPVYHYPTKRSSIEMEDELTTKEAPPTKQQLSENTLFQRFGSLQLGSSLASSDQAADVVDYDSDDSDDNRSTSREGKPVISANDRKEFDKYVYLLFKDKKAAGQYPIVANSAVERLIREEREKLSKAVILWNPPPKNTIYHLDDSDDVDGDDEDEDEFRYNDHKDFLKKPSNSVVITEIEEDAPIIIELDEDTPITEVEEDTPITEVDLDEPITVLEEGGEADDIMIE